MDGPSDEDRLRNEGARLERLWSARAKGRSLSRSRVRRDAPARGARPALFRDVAPAIRRLREPEDGQVPEPEPEPELEPELGDAADARPSEDATPDPVPPEDEPLALEADREARPEAALASVVLSSRRERPQRPRVGRLVLDLLRTGAARAAILVALASGAFYAGLFAIKPGDAVTAATVRQPRMMDKVVSVETVPVAAGAGLKVAAFPDAYARAFGFESSGPVVGFVRSVPGLPSEVCQALAAAGWTTEGWGESPIDASGECLAERRYGAGGKTNGFAVLRGGDSLSELRIKLNIGDAALRDEAARDAGRLVARFFEAWRWDGGAALEARIAALRPFEDTAFGTTVRLSREFGDVERWNLFLRFPPATRVPAPDYAGTRAGSLLSLAKLVGVRPSAGADPAGQSRR